MSTPTSIVELKRMSMKELSREIALKRAEAAKMRIGIEMGSEKDHAAYRRRRREVARMTMVLRDAERKPTNPKKPTIGGPQLSSDSSISSISSIPSSKKPVQGSRSKSRKAP